MVVVKPGPQKSRSKRFICPPPLASLSLSIYLDNKYLTASAAWRYRLAFFALSARPSLVSPPPPSHPPTAAPLVISRAGEMSSTAADVLPALPPIRTTTAPAPACSSAASSSTAPAPDAESVALPAAEKQQQMEVEVEASSEAQEQEAEAEAEPTTPTSEGTRLRPLAECPPAPRKPAWAPPPPSTPAKRKLPSSAAPSPRRAFFPVVRDLTTVFRALPPKKRIRAG